MTPEQEHQEDGPTKRVGRRGNGYENSAMHTRHPPLGTRLRMRARAGVAQAGAAAQIERAGEQLKKMTQAPASLEHGRPAGASNVVDAHRWKNKNGQNGTEE